MARSIVLSATGLLVDAFYRRIHLGGDVPRAGPVIVVANHVNQLVDVVVALRTIRRPCVTLAKAPLFHSPLTSWLVRGTGALPVHRARDGERDERAKQETKRSLATATRVVGDGGCLLLFPEGVSHHDPGVLRAHTGAARVAFAAAATASPRIVPLGLLYRDKHRFGTDAATIVGDDVDWDDLRTLWQHDEAAAVAGLTARIEDALRDVTLHLEQWDDLPLLEAASALRDDDHQRRRLWTLGEGIRRLRAHAPDALAVVRGRVADHARDLARAGARPDESPDERKRLVVAGVVRHGLSCLAAPVVAVAGLLTNRPTWVAHARTSLRDGWRFLRSLLRGRVVERVQRAQRALRAEVDVLTHAARTLPPAPATPA